MNPKEIDEKLKEIRKQGPKRKFSQTFDLIINLSRLNLKKPEENVKLFGVLPKGKGKKLKICALVDNEMQVNAEKVFDKVVLKDNFPTIKKKDVKKLAEEFDFFVAQANIMVDVAKAFGKILGQKGKMPNPKAGCVVPPNMDLKIIYEKLQRTVKLETKSELSVKCPVGTEDMSDEDLQANVLAVYNNVLSALPQGLNNIRNVIIKLTMGKPLVVKHK